MIIGDVMDELGTQLKTIDNLRVLPYEADSLNPPCATISLPSEIDYLGAYKRGMDKLILEVTVWVSRVDDRISRNQITPYADGSGARSIKTVLEAGTYTAFDTIAVSKGGFGIINLEGINYLGGIWTINIAGQGN